MLIEVSNYEDIKKELEIIEPYLQENRYCSFPVFNDGIKDFNTFRKWICESLERDTEKVFLIYDEEKLNGIVSFYWNVKERIIGISSMIIFNNFKQAFQDLLSSWRKDFSGFKCTVYFPSENRQAIAFMAELDYLQANREWVNIAFISDVIIKETNNVVKINRDNYSSFFKVHDLFSSKMYYTSDKILEEIDRWSIYSYVDDFQRTLGVVYGIVYNTIHFEIFGLDLLEDHGESVQELLGAVFRECKENNLKSVLFFAGEKISGEIQSLGFKLHTIAVEYNFTV